MKSRRWYSVYKFFSRDIWEFIPNIWEFLLNIRKFRKELWEFRWWDYHFTLAMLERSLIIMEAGMHGGLEVAESRNKKIAKMQRAIELLRHIREDDFIEQAEVELGCNVILNEIKFKLIDRLDDDDQKLYELIDSDTEEEAAINAKIFARSREIETQQWKELWILLEGQDINNFSIRKISSSTDDKPDYSDWNDWYDGTGLRGWWD